MNNFQLLVQGYTACFGWMFVVAGKWILEMAPELKLWERHTNWNDHLWYAERVNGRLAMLAVTCLLIWILTHDIKLNEILF
jgi:hypothetical protein